MAAVELRVSFPDLASLEREIAQNLKYGRAFLSEVADASVLSDCVLVLVHPAHGGELSLPAQIVMVSADGPMRGTGIEVRPFNPGVQAQLKSFVESPPPSVAASELRDPPASPEGELGASGHPSEAPAQRAQPGPPESRDDKPASHADSALASDLPADRSEQSPQDSALTDDDFDDDAAAYADFNLDADPTEDGARDEEDFDQDQPTRRAPDGSSIPPDVQFESKQDKLRHLTANDQLKVARKGELSERLVVERLYGKHVWEALLRNPRVTVPEVARIARKGTVPKPLLDLIVDNTAWIKAPQVRRALLSNPKVSSDAVLKLLRLTPKHELKLIEKGTAYAMPVREAARKLLKQ